MNHIPSKFHNLKKKKPHQAWDQIGIDPRDKSEKNMDYVGMREFHAAYRKKLADMNQITEHPRSSQLKFDWEAPQSKYSLNLDSWKDSTNGRSIKRKALETLSDVSNIMSKDGDIQSSYNPMTLTRDQYKKRLKLRQNPDFMGIQFCQKMERSHKKKIDRMREEKICQPDTIQIRSQTSLSKQPFTRDQENEIVRTRLSQDPWSKGLFQTPACFKALSQQSIHPHKNIQYPDGLCSQLDEKNSFNLSDHNFKPILGLSDSPFPFGSAEASFPTPKTGESESSMSRLTGHAKAPRASQSASSLFDLPPKSSSPTEFSMQLSYRNSPFPTPLSNRSFLVPDTDNQIDQSDLLFPPICDANGVFPSTSSSSSRPNLEVQKPIHCSRDTRARDSSPKIARAFNHAEPSTLDCFQPSRSTSNDHLQLAIQSTKSSDGSPYFSKSNSANNIVSTSAHHGHDFVAELAAKTLKARSRNSKRLQFPVSNLSRISEERSSDLDSSRGSSESAGRREGGRSNKPDNLVLSEGDKNKKRQVLSPKRLDLIQPHPPNHDDSLSHPDLSCHGNSVGNESPSDQNFSLSRFFKRTDDGPSIMWDTPKKAEKNKIIGESRVAGNGSKAGSSIDPPPEFTPGFVDPIQQKNSAVVSSVPPDIVKTPFPENEKAIAWLTLGDETRADQIPVGNENFGLTQLLSSQGNENHSWELSKTGQDEVCFFSQEEKDGEDKPKSSEGLDKSIASPLEKSLMFNMFDEDEGDDKCDTEKTELTLGKANPDIPMGTSNKGRGDNGSSSNLEMRTSVLSNLSSNEPEHSCTPGNVPNDAEDSSVNNAAPKPEEIKCADEPVKATTSISLF